MSKKIGTLTGKQEMNIKLYSNHQGTKVKIRMDFKDNNSAVSQYVEPSYVLNNPIQFLALDMQPWTVSRSSSNEDFGRLLIVESSDIHVILEAVKTKAVELELGV